VTADFQSHVNLSSILFGNRTSTNPDDITTSLAAEKEDKLLAAETMDLVTQHCDRIVDATCRSQF
jgi:hypothetical protein